MTKKALIANVVFAVALFVGFLAMPPMADDLWFSTDIYQAGLEGGSVFDSALETVRNHYIGDNGRVANVLFALSLLLPEWVGNACAIIAFSMALFLAYRLVSRGSKMRTGLVSTALMLFGVAYALPWYDYMYLECYQFNYVIATGLCTWVCYVFLNAKAAYGGLATVAVFFLSAVCGGWHEGFSVPLVCGIVAVMLLYPEFRKKKQIAILAGLICGIVWIVLCPSTFSRLGAGGGDGHRILSVIILHPAFALMVLTSAMAAFSNKGRELLRNPLTVLFGVSAMASMAVHIASVTAPRAGWWCEFASVVVVVFYANAYFRAFGRAAKIAAVLALGIVYAKLIVCDVQAFEYREQYSRYVGDYLESEDGTVYLDFTPEYSSPVIAWMAPTYHVYYDWFHRVMFAGCYGNEDKLPSVIPSSIREVRFGDAPRLESDIDIRKYGDFYFCREEELSEIAGGRLDKSGEVLATLRMGPVTRHGVRVFYFLYENVHGEKLALLLPWRIFPLSPIFSIESMEMKTDDGVAVGG
ncbi:MAG: hypothetical protein K2L96_06710 [Muribaculaceae bacterium]|nr:hypothetical protein [Muribaculaceae bacterium]